MYRFLTPFLCLLSALLAGCLSAPPNVEAESGPIPELTTVHSTGLFSGIVGFLALSEDGNTFIAGSGRSVGVYRTSDYAPLERHYIREDEPSTTVDDAGSSGTRASIYDLGYIDANTWYFSAMPFKENDVRVHVRTIHPPREIFVSTVNEITNEATASVNKNYIAYNNELIDWHTGKRYPVKTPAFDPYSLIVPTLTPDNRIITYPNEKTVIFDPLNDTMKFWKEALRIGRTIIVTPDNRHAIGISAANYRCTLWSWPERKEIGHCSEHLGWIFWGYFEYGETVALSSDSKFFAVGVGHTVRVYRIEPFKLELEVTTPGPVGKLALSDDGWLAAYDYKGFLRIWNVATGSLAGQRSFFDGKTIHGAYAPKLAFQPGSGGRLFTTYKNMTVFEAPKQTTQQKTESASGTQKE
ncbi:MAG: hypothetical protein LBI92_08105 [Azoarcus sp.]|jgi:WD40 repeat protein|nr:hypothetical protein [Azoarcus sp.]